MIPYIYAALTFVRFSIFRGPQALELVAEIVGDLADDTLPTSLATSVDALPPPARLGARLAALAQAADWPPSDAAGGAEGDSEDEEKVGKGSNLKAASGAPLRERLRKAALLLRVREEDGAGAGAPPAKASLFGESAGEGAAWVSLKFTATGAEAAVALLEEVAAAAFEKK